MCSSDLLQILVNSLVRDTFVLDGIHSVTLGGNAGVNDVLRLSFASANSKLLSKLTMLTIDLGGDSGDDLIINANNTNVTVSHTGIGSGSLLIDTLPLPMDPRHWKSFRFSVDVRQSIPRRGRTLSVLGHRSIPTAETGRAPSSDLTLKASQIFVARRLFPGQQERQEHKASPSIPDAGDKNVARAFLLGPIL